LKRYWFSDTDFSGYSSFARPLYSSASSDSQILQQTFPTKFILFSRRGPSSSPDPSPVNSLQNLADEQALMRMTNTLETTESYTTGTCETRQVPIFLTCNVFRPLLF